MGLRSGGAWESISAVTLLVATAVQGGSGLGAVYFADKALSDEDKRKDLEDEEEDQEVRRADDLSTERAEIAEQASHWSALGLLWRAILILGAALMAASAVLFQFFTADCFHEYQVSHNVLGHSLQAIPI